MAIEQYGVIKEACIHNIIVDKPCYQPTQQKQQQYLYPIS